MTDEKEPSSSAQKPSLLLGLSTVVMASAFIASIWSRFKTPIEQSDESANPKPSTNDKSAQTSPPLSLAVRVESYPQAPITKEEQAEKREERFIRRGNFLATALTAIFAAGLLYVTAKYARYTYNMWKEMQGQTCIQRAAAMNSERAWVGLDGPPTVEIGLMEDRKKMAATISLTVKNFGKGPALSLMASANIIPSDPSNRHAVEDGIETTCNLLSPFVGVKPTRLVISDEDLVKHQWGHVIFTNQSFTTGTETAIDMSKMIGKEVYVAGCIVYRDQFFEAHWTRFCYNTGDFAKDVVKDTSSFKHLHLCNANNYTDEVEKKTPACPVTEP